MDNSSAHTDVPAADEVPPTEGRHPGSHGLDAMSTLDILRLLNAEDHVAIEAVGAVLSDLTLVVDAAAERLRAGGRIHYFGAGTSGRLGVLDAAELVPTFGIDSSLVRGHIAGGPGAILRAVENSEDSEADGRNTVRDEVESGDVVIGITVAGTTPYVRGVLDEARSLGAYTALFTSNPGTPLRPLCDVVVAPDTGPEVLTGSTRLKAGTATKVLLNGFSTALMVRLGRTYSNLMVSVVATNEKLRKRTLRILTDITGGSEDEGRRALEEAGGDLKVAVVSALAKVDALTAKEALDAASGAVRDAVETLTP